MLWFIEYSQGECKKTHRQQVLAVYKPSTLSSRFSSTQTYSLPPCSLHLVCDYVPPFLFLIFTFFQFRLSTLNMNTPALAWHGVAFERISILTKYHLGFAAKKVLENGDEDMKIPLWASLKTREVKMNSAVWAFGWPHACRHGGTFLNQVGTIQSEPFKSIIFNKPHIRERGVKRIRCISPRRVACYISIFFHETFMDWSLV